MSCEPYPYRPASRLPPAGWDAGREARGAEPGLVTPEAPPLEPLCGACGCCLGCKLLGPGPCVPLPPPPPAVAYTNTETCVSVHVYVRRVCAGSIKDQ
eukprot:scaffold175259_cov15-Tisochrysis_lutea.AAC.1